MFCLFRSLATAILDYHIFLSLSTTFFIFFWILFFSTFIAFFDSISPMLFVVFLSHYWVLFILTFPTVLVNCFIFNISTSYRLHLSIFHHVIYLLILYGKRRKRDLNPRTAINDLLPFQGSPFSHLGISPKRLSFFWHKKTTDDWLVVFLTQRVGFEPTRPFGQTVFKTASLWPLRYLCIY